jgi:hypothetical protein
VSEGIRNENLRCRLSFLFVFCETVVVQSTNKNRASIAASLSWLLLDCHSKEKIFGKTMGNVL